MLPRPSSQRQVINKVIHWAASLRLGAVTTAARDQGSIRAHSWSLPRRCQQLKELRRLCPCFKRRDRHAVFTSACPKRSSGILARRADRYIYTTDSGGDLLGAPVSRCSDFISRVVMRWIDKCVYSLQKLIELSDPQLYRHLLPLHNLV